MRIGTDIVIDEHVAAFDQLRRNAVTPHKIARDDTAAESEDRSFSK
jgi:hypothetical protein